MSRFFRRGKTRVFFVPSIASQAAPTAAEVNAGTELTASIADMEGFGFATNRIDTPDLASPFTSQIGGPQEAEDSSLTIYLDSTSNPLRSTLDPDTTGFIVWIDYDADGGVVAAGQKVDVYPVIVVGTPKQRSMGDDPATWMCQFGITSVPSEDATVAA